MLTTSLSSSQPYTTLSSHTQPVTSLDIPSATSSLPPSLLLSGSEDGTLRLWDVRLNPTAKPNATYKPFRSTMPKSTSGAAITSCRFGSPLLNDSSAAQIYAVTSDSCLYRFDTRFNRDDSSASVLVGEPKWRMDLNEGDDDDELNCLSVYSRRKKKSANASAPAPAPAPAPDDGITLDNLNLNPNAKEKASFYETEDTLLSLASDNGSVILLDLTSPDFLTSLSSKNVIRTPPRLGGHDAIALITCVAFKPPLQSSSNFSSQLGGDFVSGGTDCKLCLFDGSRPPSTSRKTLDTVLISAGADEVETESGGETTSKAFNPPMVQSLSWSDSTSKNGQLAVGLGDGTIGLYSILSTAGGNKGKGSTRKFDMFRRMYGGHTKSVGCLDWCPSLTWGTWNSDSTKAKYIVTSGNEGNVVLWDVEEGKILDGVKHENGGGNCLKVGAEGGRVWIGDQGSGVIRGYVFR